MSLGQSARVQAVEGEHIWKFEMRPWSIFIDAPQGARLLSAGAQGNGIVVWALCDGNAPLAARLVAAMPTGVPLPHAFDGATFVGTAQMDDGLVFHVWDGGEQA